MSVVCFTCSDATGAVSPLSNTCYWGILCSLLLPDQNIEHVCFPNPQLQVCTKCMRMLDCIAEFRNVAINSVRSQLELWSRVTEPPSDTHYAVKVEIESVDVKQEFCEDDPVHEMKNLTGLHEEVMLETAEENSSQVKIEQQTLDGTDNQSELAHWDHWLLGAPDSNDGDRAEEHLVEKVQSEAIIEDVVDSEDEPRSEPKLSTTAIAKKRTMQPEQSPKKKIPAGHLQIDGLCHRVATNLPLIRCGAATIPLTSVTIATALPVHHESATNPPIICHGTTEPIVRHTLASAPPLIHLERSNTAAHGSATNPLLARHSSATNPPPARHRSATNPSLARHRSATNEPLARRRSATNPPLARHRSATNEPSTRHRSAINEQLARHTRMKAVHRGREWEAISEDSDEEELLLLLALHQSIA